MNIRTQKGITLVALIITIVVLLILAVVSIGAVQNSGIIGNAKNAAGGYDQAKVNEVEKLENTEEYINSIIPNNGEGATITKEYQRNEVKQILKITGEKYEITTLYKDEVMSGPVEIILVKNIDELGYTIDNRSGETNLWYVLLKEDNSVIGIAFSDDKTRIYQGEADTDNKKLNISSHYME